MLGMKTARVPLRALAILGSLVLVYPLLVWLYCLTDDYILRPGEGKWEYHKGTFWHTYHFQDGSDAQYDWQIDLCCPPYLNLGARDRQP